MPKQWPWRYTVGTGPGGRLQAQRYRHPPLSVQVEQLQGENLLKDHHLIQEREQNALLRMRVNELQFAINASEQQRQLLNNTIASLEVDYDRLDARYTRARDNVNRLQRERRELRNEIRFLQHYEGVDYRKIRHLERQFRQVEEDLEEEKRHTERLHRRFADTVVELESAQESNTRLLWNLEDKKDQIRKLQELLKDSYWP